MFNILDETDDIPVKENLSFEEIMELTNVNIIIENVRDSISDPLYDTVNHMEILSNTLKDLSEEYSYNMDIVKEIDNFKTETYIVIGQDMFNKLGIDSKLIDYDSLKELDIDEYDLYEIVYEIFFCNLEKIIKAYYKSYILNNKESLLGQIENFAETPIEKCLMKEVDSEEKDLAKIVTYIYNLQELIDSNELTNKQFIDYIIDDETESVFDNLIDIKDKLYFVEDNLKDKLLDEFAEGNKISIFNSIRIEFLYDLKNNK